MLARILAIALLLTLPASVSAKEIRSQWFSEFGVGLETGMTLLEEATGRAYDPGFGVAPDLYLGIFRRGMHRALFSLSYLFYVPDRTGGTEQFESTTSYQRLVLAGGYDFCFKYLLVGGQIGAAMMILTSERTFREIELVDIDDGVFIYEQGDTISSQKDTGVDWGFYAGLSAGVDLSDLFTDKDTGLFDIRIRADYVRRGERDDFLISAIFIFWPTGFIK
ncbi:MAG: hypothetical protein GY762_08015 [Proteobacteria bacterium]|nr:hypothetical protein [Pseudomonadota bacterium]